MKVTTVKNNNTFTKDNVKNIVKMTSTWHVNYSDRVYEDIASILNNSSSGRRLAYSTIMCRVNHVLCLKQNITWARCSPRMKKLFNILDCKDSGIIDNAIKAIDYIRNTRMFTKHSTATSWLLLSYHFVINGYNVFNTESFKNPREFIYYVYNELKDGNTSPARSLLNSLLK